MCVCEENFRFIADMSSLGLMVLNVCGWRQGGWEGGFSIFGQYSDEELFQVFPFSFLVFSLLFPNFCSLLIRLASALASKKEEEGEGGKELTGVPVGMEVGEWHSCQQPIWLKMHRVCEELAAFESSCPFAGLKNFINLASDGWRQIQGTSSIE